MLLEFSCQNHKSIRDEIIFSTLAGSETAHEPNLLTVGRWRLLRAAVLFGANGSGKSTLLDAINFVRSAVLGKSVAQTPHKLAPDTPSRYCIQFLVGDVRCVLGLGVFGQTVCEEYLYFFPHGRQVKLYERTADHLSVGVSLRRLTDLLPEALPPDKLFLPIAVKIAEDRTLQDIWNFFARTITPYRLGDSTDRLDKTRFILRHSPKIKEKALSILSMLGTGIVDLTLDGDRVITVYPDFSTDLVREESSGIRRLIDFLFPLLDMIHSGKVLLCDEPEAHLHEMLLHELLRCLMQTPVPRAQLILSTQSTALLDLSILRRDQIWFAELQQPGRVTDLYSLAEIRQVDAGTDIRREYTLGRYGAVPGLRSREGGRDANG